MMIFILWGFKNKSNLRGSESQKMKYSFSGNFLLNLSETFLSPRWREESHSGLEFWAQMEESRRGGKTSQDQAWEPHFSASHPDDDSLIFPSYILSLRSKCHLGIKRQCRKDCFKPLVLCLRYAQICVFLWRLLFFWTVLLLLQQDLQTQRSLWVQQTPLEVSRSFNFGVRGHLTVYIAQRTVSIDTSIFFYFRFSFSYFLLWNHIKFSLCVKCYHLSFQLLITLFSRHFLLTRLLSVEFGDNIFF